MFERVFILGIENCRLLLHEDIISAGRAIALAI